MLNGIQAIIFDLDGTLRHNDPPAVEVFLAHAVELGVTANQEMRHRYARWVHFYWAQSPDLLEDLHLLGNDDQFWINYARRSLKAYGCPAEQVEALAPQMHEYMKETYNPEDCVPDDVPAALVTLRQQGFRLAMLSNRISPYDDLLQSLGLADYFEFALAAGDFEVWKPDPMVFQHALQRMDVLPERSIYVGDNYYADVIGSQQAGMQPVLLDPQGIFPEADCPVIHSVGGLREILEK